MDGRSLEESFQLDSLGWGCYCAKCGDHFPTTRDWHRHAGKCIADPAPRTELKPVAEQMALEFTDIFEL